MPENKRNIILGVTGSIAAYKSADLIRRMREQDWNVSVVMTQSAQKFICPLTLGALSGNKIYTEMFESPDGWRFDHLQLAREADLVVIAPATANIIGKLAGGLADDLLSCLVLATKVPILVAPAMNSAMYAHPVVQENLRKLKDFGFTFVGPAQGKLACGDYGEGHLADVDSIVSAAVKVLEFSISAR